MKGGVGGGCELAGNLVDPVVSGGSVVEVNVEIFFQ